MFWQCRETSSVQLENRTSYSSLIWADPPKGTDRLDVLLGSQVSK